MMQQFLTGAKLPTGKPGAGSTQKSSKEKKQRPLPWVEKVKLNFFVVFSRNFKEVFMHFQYRPKKVDDVVEQQEVCAVLRESLQSADLPNLLLYGPPGKSQIFG